MGEAEMKTCPECDGDGRNDDRDGPCDWCQGAGEVPAKEARCRLCSAPARSAYAEYCDEHYGWAMSILTGKRND